MVRRPALEPAGPKASPMLPKVWTHVTKKALHEMQTPICVQCPGVQTGIPDFAGNETYYS